MPFRRLHDSQPLLLSLLVFTLALASQFSFTNAQTTALRRPTPVPSPAPGLGPTDFTAPGRFPTAVYGKYFNNPTQTSEQVQPVITDPVTVRFCVR